NEEQLQIRRGKLFAEREAGMLFGLTQDGKVFFHPDREDTAFVQLQGEPCGGVWGKPVDVDASSRAIWVVCEKEYRTEHGPELEHFLFAKWGWSTTNNHVWWHMMRGGNVVQLDADDDAMWGIDGHGNILWRPAGDVGKHSRWMRVEGPPEVSPTLIAADNNDQGTWLWCADHQHRLWRRSPGDYHRPGHEKWADQDAEGDPFWPKDVVLKDLKANQGWARAVDSQGHLLRRGINGTCCQDPASPVHCWCAEAAPLLSVVTDNGDHGLGYYFPYLEHKRAEGWEASANRWLQLLTSRDVGHNADSVPTSSQYYSTHCQVATDHCLELDVVIEEFLETWETEAKTMWQTWNWDTLKKDFSQCSRSSESCQRPLKHYGAFRERFMRHLFCCSRRLQTPQDPKCESQSCRAYDMTCPGSRLLTSDMDCTVYHSRDPGTLIKNMSQLAKKAFFEYINKPADLGILFDVSLYGTWTWIPDEIFQRFDWPKASQDLFEPVVGKETVVWVFRRKCTQTARQAILEKVKHLIHDGPHHIKHQKEDLDKLTAALKIFVGNLAEGNYHSGRSMRDWDQLYQDYRAVSSVQREGYLTYAATLEVVGRQQVGLPTTFAEDYQCMRQVSFFEQLAFIVQHIQTDVPDDISESTFADGITHMVLKSGKYFDRLLEVGLGYDEGDEEFKGRREENDADTGVLWRVLGSVYGTSHLDHVLRGVCGSDSISSMSTSAFDDAEVRRRSCMDIAMWGNAVRHMDAFRRDTGYLIQPMVQALFTCLVPPNATRGSAVKEAMLHAMDVWADAVPPLEISFVDTEYGRWVMWLGASLALAHLGNQIRLRRKNAAPNRAAKSLLPRRG
ncbi:unnamed protein product, partial [Effrenium voratum]